MNERVKELSEQAHEYSYAEYTKRLETETADKIFFNKIFNQKFAELIVRECLDICRSEDWEDQQGWGKMYAHKIQKQFGIKQ
jgi:hypothetical protein